MISENLTFKKFGYFSRDLMPGSHKRIIAVCDDCGKIREISKRHYRAFCPSCVNKGIRHYNYGKTRSNEIRKNFSATLKGRVGENARNWKGGKVKRLCLTCGKEFEVCRCEIKKGFGFFCSRKCMGIARRGEKSPNWKNGASFEPYCYKFNNEFKEYIRAKFGNVCFLCDKTEEENGQKLSVHHVNYDKHCGCAETEEDKKADDNTCQFIPLCRSCNTKVNKDRDKWETYFKNKLRNTLNGWYI